MKNSISVHGQSSPGGIDASEVFNGGSSKLPEIPSKEHYLWRNISPQDIPKLYNSSQIKRTKLFHETVDYKPGRFFFFLSFCNYGRIETLTLDQHKSNSGDLKSNFGVPTAIPIFNWWPLKQRLKKKKKTTKKTKAQSLIISIVYFFLFNSCFLHSFFTNTHVHTCTFYLFFFLMLT